MPKPVMAAALAAGLAAAALAGPVLAQSPTPPPGPQTEEPSALAREAIEKMMRALSIVIENLPQYALPEMNERGDIIIRRLNPRAEQPRRTPDTPDGTRT
jgi:hypothetical protein